MKLKRSVRKWGAELGVLALLTFFGPSVVAQNDPLNTWSQVWSTNPFLDAIFGIAYGNGEFIAVGDGARLVSYDGANWTTSVSPPIINGYYTYTNGNSIIGSQTPTAPGIAFGAGYFVAFGPSIQDNLNYILRSTNGLTWAPIYESSNGVFNAVFAAAYGNNTWVFLATNQIITASITSSNWNWTQFQPGFFPQSVAFGNGEFVISGSTYGNQGVSDIFSSTDGITWTFDVGLNLPVTSVAYGNGLFVGAAYNYKGALANPYIYNALSSSNLLQWSQTNVNSYGEYLPTKVAFGGGQFIGSFGYDIYTSTDAINWTNRTQNTINFTDIFAYGRGAFVAGDISFIYQSGTFSTQPDSPPTALAIAMYPGITINGTAGAVYQIQSALSLNSSWLPLTNLTLPFSPYIWFDTSSSSARKFYRSVQLH